MAKKEGQTPAEEQNPGAGSNAAATGDANATISGLEKAAGVNDGPNNDAANATQAETINTGNEGAKVVTLPEKQTPSEQPDVVPHANRPETPLGLSAAGPVSGPESEAAEKSAVDFLKTRGYTVTKGNESATLESVYGEGYVKATRHLKGSDPEETVFTKQAWDNLDGDKGGWKRAVKAPPEVEALQQGEK